MTGFQQWRASCAPCASASWPYGCLSDWLAYVTVHRSINDPPLESSDEVAIRSASQNMKRLRARISPTANETAHKQQRNQRRTSLDAIKGVSQVYFVAPQNLLYLRNVIDGSAAVMPRKRGYQIINTRSQQNKNGPSRRSAIPHS
jgi:hypothetical protein